MNHLFTMIESELSNTFKADKVSLVKKTDAETGEEYFVVTIFRSDIPDRDSLRTNLRRFVRRYAHALGAPLITRVSRAS